MTVRRLAIGLASLACLSMMMTRAQSPAQAPRIWDDAALADWATPIAALTLRPPHYSAAEYYSVPGDNLRTVSGFSRRPEVSCHTRAEALKLHAAIQKSETTHGSIEPRFDTTVVCTFVDDTRAACWQYSPAARDFVKVGQWTT